MLAPLFIFRTKKIGLLFFANSAHCDPHRSAQTHNDGQGNDMAQQSVFAAFRHAVLEWRKAATKEK